MEPDVNSAFVLFVRQRGDAFELLVGLEKRGSSVGVHPIGGTKEQGELDIEIAAREFHEETGCLIRIDAVRAALEESRDVYLELGNTMIFIATIPAAWENIDVTFAATHKARRGADCLMLSLHWISVDDLYDNLHNPHYTIVLDGFEEKVHSYLLAMIADRAVQKALRANTILGRARELAIK